MVAVLRASTCLFFGALCLTPALAQPASVLTSGEEQHLGRMKFEELVRALDAGEGRRIADLGAGEGAFSFALARVVGERGAVVAVDINESSLKRLQKRVADGAIRNVEVVAGAEDDPHLEAGSLDAVLLVITYH